MNDGALLVFDLFLEVQRQSEDDTLWLAAETEFEAYVQDALRTLHEKVEALHAYHAVSDERLS
jgi:hypothetical protein